MGRFGDAMAQALDATQRGDMNGAQAAVEEIRVQYHASADVARKARHDLGNVLCIAEASIEAMIDGVAPITIARLERVRHLLSDARDLLYASTPEAE